MIDLVIIGGGEHARVVIDAARSRPDEFRVIGCVDRAPVDAGVPWLGDDDAVLGAPPSNARFIVGVGVRGPDERRAAIVARYEAAGARFATVVHARAVVSPTATLAPGVAVMAQAVVNPGARVGAHAIVNTAAVVEHDVVIGDFTHVGPAAALGGGARVGARAFLGLGCRVRDHVTLGDGVLVGMGAVVVGDLPAGAVALGLPARAR